MWRILVVAALVLGSSPASAQIEAPRLPRLAGVSVSPGAHFGHPTLPDVEAFVAFASVVLVAHSGSSGVSRSQRTWTTLGNSFDVVEDTGLRVHGLLVGRTVRRGRALGWVAAGPAVVARLERTVSITPQSPGGMVVDYSNQWFELDRNLGTQISARVGFAAARVFGVSAGAHYTRAGARRASGAWLAVDFGVLSAGRPPASP